MRIRKLFRSGNSTVLAIPAYILKGLKLRPHDYVKVKQLSPETFEVRKMKQNEIDEGNING